MQRHFDQDLAKLKETILTMGSHAESAVTRAVKAVLDRDDPLAQRVKQDDEILDRFEIELDDLAINLLALHGPVASDLRSITVAMKISHDLERVGDEATTIARRALELNQEPPLKSLLDIPHLATLALAMLKDALDAFVHGNSEKARQVVLRDKEVDAINKKHYRELVSFMIADSATITRCLNLMVVSKSLERIADHATNIAEEVVYLYEAHDIRHKVKTSVGPEPAPPQGPANA